MSLVAIFTAPKPFTNPHIALIQRNAILNWKSMGPEVEIWLVGDEEGVAETAAEFGVGYIPDVERNESGTPRIDSIFNLVRKSTSAPVMTYVNADILLTDDFLSTIRAVRDARKRFLVIGQRWDVTVTHPLEYSAGWDERLMEEVLARGRRHKTTGSDYFIFPREEFTEIPHFAVGRAGWDNWMIYSGRVQHIPVIDASQSITVIHQNHDYSHLADGKIHRLQPESMENIQLMGGRFAVYQVLDADYQIVNGKITRTPLTRWKVVREISIFPAVVLKSKFLARVFYSLFNLKRAIRDWKKDRALTLEKK